jgi:glycosyltransferase involved in cell wall biosynthesis
MQTQASFSVVIPLYNKLAFVADAIRSAASQNPPPLEIIVIDDGSTDGSGDLVASLHVPTVRLLRQSNAGVAAARNAGIAVAQGEWICFLDADDLYLPGFLSALRKLQAAFPQAKVIGTGYRRTGGATSLPNMIDAGISPNPSLVKDFYNAWNRSAFFNTSSVAVARQAFLESHLRFPLGERLGEDQDLWFRLAEQYAIAFDPGVYAEYKTDVPGSATQGERLLNPLPCYGRVAERVANGTVPPHMRRGASRLVASHWLNVARARLANGDVSGAWQLIKDRRAGANATYRLRTAWLALTTRGA